MENVVWLFINMCFKTENKKILNIEIDDWIKKNVFSRYENNFVTRFYTNYNSFEQKVYDAK